MNLVKFTPGIILLILAESIKYINIIIFFAVIQFLIYLFSLVIAFNFKEYKFQTLSINLCILFLMFLGFSNNYILNHVELSYFIIPFDILCFLISTIGGFYTLFNKVNLEDSLR